MGQEASSRAASGLLAFILVVPLLVFVPAASAADASLRVVNADTGATYSTVQAALNAASIGDTITVPMGLDASSPAVYDGGATIATDGVTLCATVAVAMCVAHVEGARWSTSTGSWGAPPVAWQGQAINVGASGSTSHFPNSQDPTTFQVLQIEDIAALSFDFLIEAGGCTGGGLRAQVGLNSTGTGTTKDRTLFVYPAPSPCTLGAWRHHDLLAAENWGAAQLGGPGAGATQAQVQALAGAAHRVVSFNMIYDAAPAGSIGWFDNVRFNSAIYREQADEACLDPQSPNCLDVDAQAGTILQGGCYPVTITGDGATLRGFTVQSPTCTQVDQDFGAFDPTLVTVYAADVTIEGNVLQDAASKLAPLESRWATQAIYFDGATGTNGRVLDNVIRSIPTAQNLDGTCANSPCRTVGVWAREGAIVRGNVIEGDVAGAGQAFGILVSSPGSAGFTIADNRVMNWAHSGIYVGGSADGPGTISDNEIGNSRANAILVEGTRPTQPLDITGNDLRGAAGANLRIDSNRPLTLRENILGLSQNTLSFSTRFPGFAADARYNHWGADTRDEIEATIQDDGASHTVDVSCYYRSDDVTAVCPPAADFTFAPATAHINRAVAFTDTTIAGGNDVASWAWGFGDGQTSAARNPAHSFANNGVFAVTLVATDEEGFSSSVSMPIAIANSAPVLGAIGPRSGAEAAALAFTIAGTDADGDALTYAMSGAPSGATLHATSGAFAWTPAYTQAGTYTVLFTTTDGDLSDSESALITIGNVDRAPSIGSIASITLRDGASGTTNAQATDADGDAITLAAIGLPAYGTFTDLGNGAGTFAWSPGVAHVGTATVTLEATSNGLTSTRSFSVTVVREAKLALVHVTPALARVSPGLVTLTATITNLGTTSDTFRFTTNAPAAWNVEMPADVTLAPGVSVNVAVKFVMPANSPVRALTLTAASTATTLGSKTILWTILEPLVLTIVPDELAYTVRESISGLVRVTYLDGTPAVGMNVELRQTPSGATFLASEVNGVTDGAGEFVFDFGLDVGSRMRGEHKLVAKVEKPEPYEGTGRYAVN